MNEQVVHISPPLWKSGADTVLLTCCHE